MPLVTFQVLEGIDKGRVFRELQPYALYPLDEYFGGTVRKELPGGLAESSTRPSNVIRMPERRNALRLLLC